MHFMFTIDKLDVSLDIRENPPNDIPEFPQT